MLQLRVDVGMRFADSPIFVRTIRGTTVRVLGFLPVVQVHVDGQNNDRYCTVHTVSSYAETNGHTASIVYLYIFSSSTVVR